MKLLIDISKNDYEEIKEYGINTFSSLAIAIQNGTPLEEELKTIRVKITACTAQGEGNFCDIHNNAIEMARNVVDKRISELEGE